MGLKTARGKKGYKNSGSGRARKGKQI